MAASNDLTGNNPAATFSQLLHIGTGTASVATVRTGNGTATVMSFVSGGFKITGTMQVTSTLQVDGATTMTGNVTMGGSLTLNGVDVKTPVYKRLTADVNAPTTTNVAITEFDFTPVNGATYEIELALTAYSAASGTGVRIVNTSGAGNLMLSSVGEALGITATGGTYSATSAPAATTNFGILLKGYFTASSTATLSWALVSEVAASQVTLKAGSILRITRIA